MAVPRDQTADSDGSREPQLFTIGHSNHSLAHFVLLLRQHQVTAVADVRSSPFSRRHPQFNRERLAEALWASAEIRYACLGPQLGARPEEPECYLPDGRLSFSRFAATPTFKQGVKRLLTGLERKFRIALLCAERDPLQCHRGILIAPRLAPLVPSILHIGGEGELESHAQAEQRLLREQHAPEQELFRTTEERLEDAYLRREEQIAWRRSGGMDADSG